MRWMNSQRLLGGAEITEKSTGKCRGDETSGRGDEESQSCTSNRSGMNRQNEKKLTGLKIKKHHIIGVGQKSCLLLFITVSADGWEYCALIKWGKR